MERHATTASQMNRLDCLGDNQSNCLSHLDFAARTILVEIRLGRSVTVTGVSDFDSFVFAPCASLVETQPDDAMKYKSQSNEKPRDPEQLEINCVFEETVRDNSLRCVYQSHFGLCEPWSQSQLSKHVGFSKMIAMAV